MLSLKVVNKIAVDEAEVRERSGFDVYLARIICPEAV
jgi:hypothetical protein